jgi:hypothetical protein
MSKEKEMLGMLEAAWGLLANVDSGNWNEQPLDWRKAAGRWRASYRDLLKLIKSNDEGGLAYWRRRQEKEEEAEKSKLEERVEHLEAKEQQREIEAQLKSKSAFRTTVDEAMAARAEVQKQERKKQFLDAAQELRDLGGVDPVKLGGPTSPDRDPRLLPDGARVSWGGKEMIKGRCPDGIETCNACCRLGYHLEEPKEDEEPPSVPSFISKELSLDDLKALRVRALKCHDWSDALEPDEVMVLIGMAEVLHFERGERYRLGGRLAVLQAIERQIVTHAINYWSGSPMPNRDSEASTKMRELADSWVKATMK